jgi:septal ring factor EnvC (AmiA/AmiB activator)
MTCYRKIMAVVLCSAMLAFSSCEEKTTTTTEEQTRINSMDSTARVVSGQKEKLEEQTKKVEESLEKLDKEFDTTKN